MKARKDFSRWTIRHIIYKNKDTVAAIITIDGAWLNTKERKLAIPTQEIIDVFSKMPRANDFEWEVKSE